MASTSPADDVTKVWSAKLERLRVRLQEVLPKEVTIDGHGLVNQEGFLSKIQGEELNNMLKCLTISHFITVKLDYEKNTHHNKEGRPA